MADSGTDRGTDRGTDSGASGGTGGADGDPLAPLVARAGRVLAALDAGGLTLGTVEASLGGLLGALLTAVPGASRVFLGGVAPYARAPKVELLGVDEALLLAEGSVSEAAARALAEGGRRVLRADLVVAETGVASDVGNPLRPAGLYLVALAGPGETHVTRHRFAGDRGAVRRQAAAAALDLLLAYLEETR